jgi:hypothetical protein
MRPNTLLITFLRIVSALFRLIEESRKQQMIVAAEEAPAEGPHEPSSRPKKVFHEVWGRVEAHTTETCA